MKTLTLTLTLALLVAMKSASFGQTDAQIDFEALPANTTLTTQYEAQGITFFEGPSLTGVGFNLLPVVTQLPLAMDLALPGGLLLHTDAQAHSGSHVADISVCTSQTSCEFFVPAAAARFTKTVQKVQVFVGALPGGAGYSEVTLRAFGIDRQLLATAKTTVNAGDGIKTLLAVEVDGIAFFEISGSPTSTLRLAIDDLSFETSASALAPNFQISGPSSLEVRQGGSAEIKILVERFNGSTGIVSFGVAGLPSGFVAKFKPSRSRPGAGAEEVTLTVSASVDAPLTGTNPIAIDIAASPSQIVPNVMGGEPTIVDTGAGPSPQHALVHLFITDSFFLQLAGASHVDVPPCGQAEVPITIVRAPDFTDPMILDVFNLPPGVSSTIKPDPIFPDPSGAVASHAILTIASVPMSNSSTGTATIRARSISAPSRQIAIDVAVSDTLCCPIAVPNQPSLPRPSSRGGGCTCQLPNGPAGALDVQSIGSLAYTKDIRVINLYWGGNNWDAIPGHGNFQKKDIETAMQKLFETRYFEPLCQYGGPSGGPTLILLPGVDTGQALNPCLPHVPQDGFTIADLFQLVACEEGFPFTDVPRANGIPTEVLPGGTGLACTLCGFTIMPCYMDGMCLSTPNPTGDLVINIIPPKNKHLFVKVGGTCKDPDFSGFHWQVPSNALGYPLLPLVQSQGRPIYFTFSRTDCLETIEDLIKNITHELVEAVTDPVPGAFWYSDSYGQLAHNGEIADICDSMTANGDYVLNPAGQKIPRPNISLAWTDAHNLTHSVNVSAYWSNYHHDCIAPLMPRAR